MENVLLKVKNVSKSFFGVNALTDVSFTLNAGEIHSLVGENGAGKSTVMKVISGIYSLDVGEMYVCGEKVNFKNILDAFKSRITLVHQELINCQNVSVAENIFMGEIGGNTKNLFDIKSLNLRASQLLKKFDVNIKPEQKISTLSVSEQQIVEIAKALSINAKIIIFDEPTASLTELETKKLFKIIYDLKNNGVGIVYISHRMEEVCTISDVVTVLRDGSHI